MAADEPNPLQFLFEQFADTAARVDENRQGHVVAELAIITMLIDAKLVTIEEACQRLELVQSALPERYQSDETTQRVRLLTTWLRAHVKPDTPGPSRWSPQVIEGGKDRD